MWQMLLPWHGFGLGFGFGLHFLSCLSWHGLGFGLHFLSCLLSHGFFASFATEMRAWSWFDRTVPFSAVATARLTTSPRRASAAVTR